MKSFVDDAIKGIVQIHKKKFLLFLAVIFTTCVEPYDMEKESAGNKIIVEGLFSNEERLVVIRLKALKTGDINGNGAGIKGAIVSISDEDGKIFDFKESDYIGEEKAGGIYESQEPIAGEIGKSYTLNITLMDGRKYRSNPEILVQPIPIDSISIEEYDYSPSDYGYKVLVHTKDPVGKGNFYFYNWERTFKIITDCPLPPTSCKNTKLECWSVVYSNAYLNVVSDENFDGNTFVRDVDHVKLCKNALFSEMVKQYSISKQTYNYFEVVNQQLTNSGTIMDPPPSQNKSNVYNIDNPEDLALGYFVVGSVKTKRKLIDFNGMNKPNLDPLYDKYYKEVKNGDCRDELKGEPVKITTKPDYWP